MSGQRTSAIAISGLLSVAGLLLLMLSSELWLATAAAQAPVLPAASGEQCVADTDLMRKNHMDMLDHQRDETVIDGVRGKPFSLVGCVNCHAANNASGEPIRIDAEGQFCQGCHEYAAVSIDCFSCHAAVPESQSQQQNRLGLNHHHPESGSASVAQLSVVLDSAFSGQSVLATAALHSADSPAPVVSSGVGATSEVRR